MFGNIDTPVKRYLMAFRWRANDGPLIVALGSSLPSSTKKIVVKVGPTPSDKSSGSARGGTLSQSHECQSKKDAMHPVKNSTKQVFIFFCARINQRMTGQH